MSSAPVIRVRHVWHRFGGADVLRDVTFDVGEGEIFGFIGPNGAGKTTTIRIMATLLEPTAGRVEVDGLDVTIAPEKVRRVIGYMPDHAGIYDRITVREYLEFFADAFGIDTLDIVPTVLELTDLTGLHDRLVATLSKGMRQRLQLARVLLHDPKILILDEPASDLDPRARIELRDLLLELRALGKTIFLSSHILTELADICTSVAILERGRLVVAGPLHEIADRLAGRPPPSRDAAVVPGGIDPAFDAGHAAPGQRRRVKLRVLGDAGVLADLLSNVRGVDNIDVQPGGQAIVTYYGDDSVLADMVRHMVGNRVALVGVEPERSELERIFLEATRGELQ